MKKLLCALLAAALLLSCAALAEDAAAADEPEIISLDESEVTATEVDPAEDEDEGDLLTPVEPEEAAEAEEVPAIEPSFDAAHIGFEDGFALALPEGWLFHPTTAEMAEKDVVYCLSDAAGAGWLYIQSWESDCADMNELKALIDRTADIQTSGVYAFNGTDFVVYDLTEGDVSCCAALLNGKVLNLVFTPQSDADFMAVAAQILNTFETL